MKRIRPGFILPSVCYTLSPKKIAWYLPLDKTPEVGDVVYCRVRYIGEHGSLENKEGRIHTIHDGTRAILVFGNRYAPDAFEGMIPKQFQKEVDLLSRSGIVGTMVQKSAGTKDPTKVEVLGYVVDDNQLPLNTRKYSLFVPTENTTLAQPKKDKGKSKMILHVGTSMNSGKSTSAVACCWALSTMGYKVRASKITGTAGLKDILHMQDGGAEKVADFSFLGIPSTFMLDIKELLRIFETLDGKLGNNSSKFWVVEFADGILQRETSLLLKDTMIRQRIHRLIFSAADAVGAIGGIRVLKEKFEMVPDAISGRCTASPLGVSELRAFTDIPIFNNMVRNLDSLRKILLEP